MCRWPERPATPTRQASGNVCRVRAATGRGPGSGRPVDGARVRAGHAGGGAGRCASAAAPSRQCGPGRPVGSLGPAWPRGERLKGEAGRASHPATAPAAVAWPPVDSVRLPTGDGLLPAGDRKRRRGVGHEDCRVPGHGAAKAETAYRKALHLKVADQRRRALTCAGLAPLEQCRTAAFNVLPERRDAPDGPALPGPVGTGAVRAQQLAGARAPCTRSRTRRQKVPLRPVAVALSS